MRLILPPKNLVARPNREDPLIYYYLPVTGYVYKKRLKNTLELLGGGPYEKLLDIGFGSGILFPELGRRAEHLFGIEMHEAIADVKKMLDALRIPAELKQASLFQIPYPDKFFDAVISVSVFEHLRELDKAFDELLRVLKPGGIAVISFPVRNIITDAFFRLVGFNPREIHPASHWDIIHSARRHLAVEKILIFPKFLPVNLSLYCSMLCKKKAVL